MPSLSVLRVVIPLVVLGLLALFAFSLKPRPPAHTRPLAGSSGAEDLEERVQDFSITELVGSIEKLRGAVELIRETPEGRLILEGVRELAIERGERGPLLVSARLGEGSGRPGERHWRFEDEVVLRDPAAGLSVFLPSVHVDEQAGLAQATGSVRFEGPALAGEADAITYDLTGRPSVVMRPRLSDPSGATLTAERAALHEGLRIVELEGAVEGLRPGERLRSRAMRLRRDEEDRLRHLVATGEVRGAWEQGPGLPEATLGAERLETAWDAAGAVERMDLDGSAELARGAERLGAPTIVVRRDDTRWRVAAAGGAWARAPLDGSPTLLRAEELDAVLDGAWRLLTAEARGRVTFESAATRAEAEQAVYDAARGAEVRLDGGERGKARLARENSRVAAERMVTDPRGERLVATGSVEATLLPGERASAAEGLFVAGEAVHFVAESLTSEARGERLEFRGAVRGWQGERNLSAGVVTLDQGRRTLAASERVTTRIPRRPDDDRAAARDFLQVSAERLDYDDAAGRAVYTGGVRLSLDEGWLEARRVEIDLAPAGRQVEEVRAFDEVRVEFRPPEEAGAPQPLGGTADRAVYRPASSSVWLYGERTPAAVRRLGGGGGTTSGKALRYRLDLGTLEVESGARGTVRIGTPERR